MSPSYPWWAWSTGGGSRPAPRRQPALTPFDPSDPGGLVHTTLPPEAAIPSGYDRNFWRADPWGVTLTATPPFVPGANTTPPEMVMSYMLHRYPRVWQDDYLTESCYRNFSHLLLSGSGGYDPGPGQDPSVKTDWRDPTLVRQTFDFWRYCQSWGFYTGCWLSPWDLRDGTWLEWLTQLDVFLDTLTHDQALCDRSFVILGKELDGFNVGGPTGLDNIIAGACRTLNAVGVPVWLHFNANVPAWPPPGMDFSAWWRQWIGRVTGLMWQGDPNDVRAHHIGTLGAHMYDARRVVGHASTDFKFVAFEPGVATEQLYGRCDETRGARIGWELSCCPMGDAGAPLSGASAQRYPDGRPL